MELTLAQTDRYYELSLRGKLEEAEKYYIECIKINNQKNDTRRKTRSNNESLP